MTIIRMDTEAALKLEQSYLQASRNINDVQLRLTQPLSQAQNLALSSTLNSSIGGSGVQVAACFEIFRTLTTELEKNALELSQHREWMNRSDLIVEDYSFLPNSKYSHYSTLKLLDMLAKASELPDSELNSLLSELAVRTLDNPELANRFLEKLGTPELQKIFERIHDDLGRWLLFDSDISVLSERQSLHLLPLSILLANASYAEEGISPETASFFFPRTSTADSATKIRYLGMALGSAKFAPVFVAGAGLYLLNKTNRQNVAAALSNNHLELPVKKFPQKQPFAKLLNPGETTFKQILETPEAILEFFTHPGLASLVLDTDTLLSHQIDFWPVFSEGMAQLEKSVWNDSEAALRIKSAIPNIGIFLYRNQSHLVRADNFLESSAKMLSLFIPDMRSMATQVTAPLLAPITQNPESMIIFSGSVGVFALGHLYKALEAEFDPSLSYEQKQRTISAHVDAVTDVYHHMFVAISLEEHHTQQSMSFLSAALGFAVSNFSSIALSRLPLSRQLALSTAGFAADKIRERVFRQANDITKAHKDLTPRELFARQIINRDFTSGQGSVYPEPTWFEIEIAKKVLEQLPSAAADLETGKWFDGKTLTPPLQRAKVGANITSPTNEYVTEVDSTADLVYLSGTRTNLGDFSEWFAKTINADPPTEFSGAYLHIQREFGTDLLLDALSVELDSVAKDAAEAKVAANAALEESEYNRYAYSSRRYQRQNYGGGYLENSKLIE